MNLDLNLWRVHKGYQTVKSEHLEEYPKVEKKNAVSGLIKNVKRSGLFVEKDIVKDHLKE